MKEENEIFFADLPAPDVEYEIHVLMPRPLGESDVWFSVDFGRDYELLRAKIAQPTWKYADKPRRIIAIHHKAQVVDWIDPEETHLPIT